MAKRTNRRRDPQRIVRRGDDYFLDGETRLTAGSSRSSKDPIEAAVDAALGELVRQTGPIDKQILLEARGEGVRAGARRARLVRDATAPRWEPVLVDGHDRAHTRRMAVPGGWLYQVARRAIYDHFGMVVTGYEFHPPIFVAKPPKDLGNVRTDVDLEPFS